MRREDKERRKELVQQLCETQLKSIYPLPQFNWCLVDDIPWIAYQFAYQHCYSCSFVRRELYKFAEKYK